MKKAGSHRELNPGHLWLEPPVLCHWATATRQPPTLTILYMYCAGGTECLSCTPGSHSVCAVRSPLGVDRQILSIRKEPILSGFLTLNAHGTYWVAARCATEAFSTTCAVHIEDCEGFTFLYLRLITSKFLYFQLEAGCSEQEHARYVYKIYPTSTTEHARLHLHVKKLARGYARFI